MKRSLAELFGSFFLYPAAIMLLGAIILGTGCGSTPEPAAPVQSTGDVTLFYSQPGSQPEEPPAVPDDDSIPEVAAESEEDLPPQIENSDDPGEESSDYLISPHDVLDISVLGEEELSLIVRVSEKGVISFPLLGGIQAAGFTSIELERELERKLEKDFLVSPSVNISIKE